MACKLRPPRSRATERHALVLLPVGRENEAGGCSGRAEGIAMAKVPADHLEYLRRRPFAFGCSTAVFPPAEVEALAQYGNWLQALASGAIRPVTAEQEHFLKVDREE